MAIDDIPAGEQLMHAPAVPPESPALRMYMEGLGWPGHGTATGMPVEAGLRDDSLAWIRKVLKPEYVAPDLASRLAAAPGAVDGKDALLARYRINGATVQIVVMRFHVHLLLAPEGESPVAAMHHYLRVDEPAPAAPWQGPWQVVPVAAATVGYQLSGSPNDWRDTLSYLADGHAVKFSLRKIGDDFRSVKGFVAHTDEAERSWFNAR